MIQLSSRTLKASIDPEGAELTRLVNINNGQDLIWDAKPEIWNRHAPILFPIVGGLKGGGFTFGEKEYQLGRHGFVRDSDFEVVNSTENLCKLRLIYDADTLAHYPFKFELMVMYELKENRLFHHMTVSNLDDKPISYGIGAHPAFSLQQQLNLYRLQFEKDEKLQRHVLDADGLRNGQYKPVETLGGLLTLHEKLFEEDALVFEQCSSKWVSLFNEARSYHLRVSWEGYTHLGLWKKPSANFLCIEPWAGLADRADHNRRWEDKDALEHLEIGGSKTYTMVFDFQV